MYVMGIYKKKFNKKIFTSKDNIYKYVHYKSILAREITHQYLHLKYWNLNSL